MGDYRKYFDPLIKDVEGYSDDTYEDHKGTPTVGTGLNLEDADVQGLMKIRGIDPEEVKTGNRQLASDELDEIHNSYIGKREKLVRNRLGEDLYDTLQPHEKAAVMSMGYQSLNNVGPNFTQAISSNDRIGAIREMILNTNKDQNPGILSRRFREAEVYGGPEDFSSAFKTMTPVEISKLQNIINKLTNDNVKQEIMQKYGQYLNQPAPVKMDKLQQLLNGKTAGK